MNIIKETEIEKIIVTHGTDTMIETANFVADNLENTGNKIVVFTGAFLPESFKDSDADFNVGVALGAFEFFNM